MPPRLRVRSPRVGHALAAGLAVALSSCVLAACGDSAVALRRPSITPIALAVRPGVVAPAGSTLIANVHGVIDGYFKPDGAISVFIAPTWHGAATVLPVIKSRPGWLDVRLASRPNGSTAWIQQTDVTLTSTPYKILIDLATRRLSLFRDDRLIFGAPAGVGTFSDPSPTGQFFVALVAQPPNAGYGPFVLVTSAHSNAISDWEMSGDALMAIHGPLGDDSEIGTTGAYISHGCIRLHVVDLLHLRQVPAGSPVEVVSSL